MHRIAGEAINRVGNDRLSIMTPRCFSHPGKLGPLPQLCTGVNLPIDGPDGVASLCGQCATLRLLYVETETVLLARCAYPNVDVCHWLTLLHHRGQFSLRFGFG